MVRGRWMIASFGTICVADKLLEYNRPALAASRMHITASTMTPWFGLHYITHWFPLSVIRWQNYVEATDGSNMERAPPYLHPTVTHLPTTSPPHPIFPSSPPYTPFHTYGGSGSHVMAFESENNVGKPIAAEGVGGEFKSKQRRGSFVRTCPHKPVDFFPWPPHNKGRFTLCVTFPFRLCSVRMVCVHTVRCVQSPSRTA
jgi:hypothetical protein